MLSLRVGGVRVRLYFGFFAALTFYFYLYGRDAAAVGAALACCLLHELGHLAAMTAMGCPPRAVCFYAGGIKLVPARGVVPRSRQAVVLAAGSSVNLLLAAASCAAGQRTLMYVNLAVGLLNLLPLGCLDGGRLLALYLSDRARRLAAAVIMLPLCALAAVVSPLSAVLLVLFAAAAETVMNG